MILELALLFILVMAVLLAHYISAQVPDEAPVAGKYLELGTDASFLIILGITIWVFDLKILAIAIPIVLIVARRLWSITQLYAPVTGAALAVCTYTSIAATIVLLILLLNYLVGIQAKSAKDALRKIWLQPVAAIIIYAIINLTQAI